MHPVNLQHPLQIQSSRRFIALISLKEGEDPKWMDRRRLLTKIQNIREFNAEGFFMKYSFPKFSLSIDRRKHNCSRHRTREVTPCGSILVGYINCFMLEMFGVWITSNHFFSSLFCVDDRPPRLLCKTRLHKKIFMAVFILQKKNNNLCISMLSVQWTGLACWLELCFLFY